MKHALTLLSVLIAPVATATLACAEDAQSSPYGIFTHARDVWRAERYPDFVGYTISVRVVERGVEKFNHYHVSYDAKNDRVNVEAVSDEEQATPAPATGINLHIGLKRQGRTLLERRVGNAEEAVDYLGVPVLAPNYAFGMSRHLGVDNSTSDEIVRQVRAQFHDPMPSTTAKEIAPPPGLKEIAVVSASHRDYDVALSGIEDVDGTKAYHLVLHPVVDPSRFRLRELWVAKDTFATLKLINAGNFTASNVPWLVTFSEVNGARYIASEVALDPVRAGDHRYDNASISFEGISPMERPQFAYGSLVVPADKIVAEPKD